MHKSPPSLCTRCHKNPPRPNQCYCLECHREYVKQWRKANPGYHRKKPTNPEQLTKIKARAKAWDAKCRGKLIQLPCQVCGGPSKDRHHPDYSKPLYVVWLCKKCHRDIHRKLDHEL